MIMLNKQLSIKSVKNVRGETVLAAWSAWSGWSALVRVTVGAEKVSRVIWSALRQKF